MIPITPHPEGQKKVTPRGPSPARGPTRTLRMQGVGTCRTDEQIATSQRCGSGQRHLPAEEQQHTKTSQAHSTASTISNNKKDVTMRAAWEPASSSARSEEVVICGGAPQEANIQQNRQHERERESSFACTRCLDLQE
jgi:hypothetical protein